MKIQEVSLRLIHKCQQIGTADPKLKDIAQTSLFELLIKKLMWVTYGFLEMLISQYLVTAGLSLYCLQHWINLIH